MMTSTKVNGKTIEVERWQDPYGPTHSFYLSLPHIERGIPQKCTEADYHCVRILAGHAAKDELRNSIHLLTDVQFGIQVLGFKMPWAWNKYLEDKEENDAKYAKYVGLEIIAYFESFLERAKLPKSCLELVTR